MSYPYAVGLFIGSMDHTHCVSTVGLGLACHEGSCRGEIFASEEILRNSIAPFGHRFHNDRENINMVSLSHSLDHDLESLKCFSFLKHSFHIELPKGKLRSSWYTSIEPG